MKYVIWCDLVYAWVGDVDESSGKYKTATVLNKAKVFPSVSSALATMKLLPKHWSSHMEIREYTKGTQSEVRSVDISAVKS